jgi:hypothetical protein
LAVAWPASAATIRPAVITLIQLNLFMTPAPWRS